jgi:nitroimidazol reductase NimA-like FMN-containing flavoprotein (pyridoxamine 5'-phosphate oxidase superfamily)
LLLLAFAKAHKIIVTVQEIVDANRYMTLATADETGTPWASPVWFATDDLEQFFWVSDPNARHSRNIAARPQIAIVIYDSTVAPGDAQAVYIAATAERSDDIAVYARESEAQGLRAWSLADVTEPARHRLYRATATEHFVLGPGDQRLPMNV